MSRNKIIANRNVFSRLINFAKAAPEIVGDLEGDRYLKTNPDEQKWLLQLKFVRQAPVLPRLSVASFIFEEREFLSVVGDSNDEVFFEGLIPFEMNAGIFTALVSELQITIRSNTSPYDVANRIIGRRVGEDGYEGHDFDDIKNLFAPVCLLEIQDDFPLKSHELERLAGVYMTASRTGISLPFSADTMVAFQKVFLNGSPQIPFENVLCSMVAVHWQHVFLELYK